MTCLDRWLVFYEAVSLLIYMQINVTENSPIKESNARSAALFPADFMFGSKVKVSLY